MVITSLSERWGAGPGRFKACWITGDPFIASSTMVKRVVRTVAFSSIRSALLVCLCVYKLKRTTVLFLCHQLAQSVFVVLCLLDSAYPIASQSHIPRNVFIQTNMIDYYTSARN